jgi:hypothetical protein
LKSVKKKTSTATKSNAAMAWVPAIWGTELLMATVVSRCVTNRAVEVADQVTGVLFRMAGLGLGPFPSKSTDTLLLGNSIAAQPDELADGRIQRVVIQAAASGHVLLNDNSASPASVVHQTNLIATPLYSDALGRMNAYNRTRIIQSVLIDAVRAFAPSAVASAEAGGRCGCGSILCTSSTLLECLRQLEETLVCIMHQLIDMNERIEANERGYWFQPSRPTSANVTRIQCLLPEAERQLKQLFTAVPWIQMTTTASALRGI